MGKRYIKISMIIMLIGLLTLFFVGRKNNNVSLADVELQEENNNNSTFAIMLEEIDEEGNETYTQSASNTFPTNGYKLNEEKTSCIDMNGKKLENVITYDNGNITIHTNGTSYCYLYFNQEENISKICNGSDIGNCMASEEKLNRIKTIENLSNDLIKELYRYHGLEVDNYICFGTNDKEDCIKEQDKYLYRIIGITKDGNLKLIKNTSIGNLQWNDKETQKECGNDGENCNWEKSTLKNYLNTVFLNNTEYIPTEWQDKILEMNWNVGVTKAFSEQPYAERMYEKESSAKTTDKLKIGLMYLSDHYYAYDNGAGVTDCDKFYCNSWIFYHTAYEWTMTFVGFDSGYNLINAGVNYLLEIGSRPLTSEYHIRPVFYLTNTIHLSGLGTINNPYLITK